VSKSGKTKHVDSQVLASGQPGDPPTPKAPVFYDLEQPPARPKSGTADATARGATAERPTRSQLAELVGFLPLLRELSVMLPAHEKLLAALQEAKHLLSEELVEMRDFKQLHLQAYQTNLEMGKALIELGHGFAGFREGLEEIKAVARPVEGSAD